MFNDSGYQSETSNQIIHELPDSGINNKSKDFEIQITELKKENRSLQEEIEIYRLWAESTSDAVLISQGSRILYCNPVFEKFTGYPLKNILQKRLKEFIAPDDMGKITTCHEKLLKRDETPCPIEIRVKHNSEGSFWTQAILRIFRYREKLTLMTVLHDLSDRKKAEKAEELSDYHYHSFAEHSADGVAVILNGEISLANSTLASMLGFDEEDQLLGLNPVDFFHENYKTELIHTIHTLKIKDNSENFQTQFICRDGRQIWIEGRNTIIPWKGEKAVLITIRDITRSKQLEMTYDEERKYLQKENIQLKNSLRERYRFGPIVGKSPAMQDVYELILKATSSDAHVVIYGESGTGKELVAKTIHDLSSRKDKSFVPVNCGAIPESLFESEFFGYRKGAFTGAQIDKHGFFDLADEGTLFLDEVGELTLNMQVKLLRAIEGGGFTPVGDKEVKRVNVRILAATNRDLTDMIRKGLMREDFFYRIHVIPITLPPLRERKEDLPLLTDAFLDSKGFDRKKNTIPMKVFHALDNYEWPGNVRELHNVLQRYLTVNSLDFLNTQRPVDIRSSYDSDTTEINDDLSLRDALDVFEKDFISKALSKNKWHRGNTADDLDIPARTLHRKMKKLGLAAS